MLKRCSPKKHKELGFRVLIPAFLQGFTSCKLPAIDQNGSFINPKVSGSMYDRYFNDTLAITVNSLFIFHLKFIMICFCY